MSPIEINAVARQTATFTEIEGSKTGMFRRYRLAVLADMGTDWCSIENLGGFKRKAEVLCKAAELLGLVGGWM